MTVRDGPNGYDGRSEHRPLQYRRAHVGHLAAAHASASR